MKSRRAFLTSSLLVPAAGGLALLAPPPARAAVTWSTALVPVTGTVGGEPEGVAFSGQAKIDVRLSRDDVNLTRTPSLVLQIDLSGVTAVGVGTAASYVLPGMEIAQRPLAASDVVEFAFPFYQSGAEDSARNAVASFALSFDLNTGAITAGTATVTGA